MTATLYCGDVRQVLAGLPDGSVQACITSPPYWSLRDYQMAGQLGLERTPEEYVANIVAVFREVRRVLRDDGTLWLNLGDSYAAGGTGGASAKSTLQNQGGTFVGPRPSQVKLNESARSRSAPPGLKPKDLVGIPWAVAFALRADGWYLRSEIIWSKPNPMPESVTDRPTKAHEQIFLLSKSASYYYDASAIAEPAEHAGRTVSYDGSQKNCNAGDFINDRRVLIGANGPRSITVGATRNARSVWTIPTTPYPGSHFATFPEELARRCILAGSAAKACESCGAPWERVTEHTKGDTEANGRPKRTAGMESRTSTLSLGGDGSREWAERGGKRETVGWQPTCACSTNTGASSSIVLDPFGGSGTTCAVAVGHGRRAIYIDLNPQYLELARQRIGPMLCEDAPAQEAA